MLVPIVIFYTVSSLDHMRAFAIFYRTAELQKIIDSLSKTTEFYEGEDLLDNYCLSARCPAHTGFGIEDGCLSYIRYRFAVPNRYSE